MQLARLGKLLHAGDFCKGHVDGARHHRDHRLARALERHVRGVDLGRVVEQFGHELVAGRARPVIQHAGLGLGARDQLGQGLVLGVAGHHDERGRPHHHRERRKVGHGVIRQLLEQRHVHGQRGVAADEHGVAVGRRREHGLDGNEAVGAGLVLDHHGLAGELGELAAEVARRGVGAAARRKGHDELDGLGRKFLRGGVAGAECHGHRQQRHGEVLDEGHAWLHQSSVTPVALTTPAQRVSSFFT
jgi:hypothetical protein